jgi:hypothetical protein
LQHYRHTEKAARSIKEVLNFELNMQLPQRKIVELGQVISRIVSMEMVLDLGIQGFHKELIDNCLGVLQKEISGLMGHFKVPDNFHIVEDYQQNGSWLNFI